MNSPRELKRPPAILDGAKVIEWAWSGDRPFGFVPGGEVAEAIYGLAIARYDGKESVYRFSCDASWEVVQDAMYSSPDEAKKRLPTQYQGVPVLWHT